MDDKFLCPSELSAGDFKHLNGSLVDHLHNTRNILIEWSASSVLIDAGLYHAVYGTSGFNESLVSIVMREKIARIIGPESEEIVYQYCACDREYFFRK